jgi:hypothetical protein
MAGRAGAENPVGEGFLIVWHGGVKRLERAGEFLQILRMLLRKLGIGLHVLRRIQ